MQGFDPFAKFYGGPPEIRLCPTAAFHRLPVHFAVQTFAVQTFAVQTEDEPRDRACSLDLTLSAMHQQADVRVGLAGLPACARSCSD